MEAKVFCIVGCVGNAGHRRKTRFDCQCGFDEQDAHSQSTIMCFLLLPDEVTVSSDDSGRSFMERGQVRQDFVDLSVCTREKMAHVKDCKTGSQSLLVTI